MAGCRYAPNNKPSMGALNNGLTLASGTPIATFTGMKDAACVALYGAGARYGSNSCNAGGGGICTANYDPGCLLPDGTWKPTSRAQSATVVPVPKASSSPSLPGASPLGPAAQRAGAVAYALPLAAAAVAAALLYLWRK